MGGGRKTGGSMLEGVAFLLFGFLGGLAYLAYHQERDLVAYGLAGLGLACALWGVELLIDSTESGMAAFELTVSILRFVAMGGGLSFLAYVGATEGRAYYRTWKAKRDAEIDALRAGLRLDARKDAEAPRIAGRSS